jgi:hypothetical protein
MQLRGVGYLRAQRPERLEFKTNGNLGGCAGLVKNAQPILDCPRQSPGTNRNAPARLDKRGRAAVEQQT